MSLYNPQHVLKLSTNVAEIINEDEIKESTPVTTLTPIEVKQEETVEEVENIQLLEEIELSEDNDDGLINVNVKERRQCLMQMLKNNQVFQTLEQNATLSRIAAKNAAVVKMAVQNLQNNSLKNLAENETGETDSILAIEASSRVKLMVSKFDNKPVSVE